MPTQEAKREMAIRFWSSFIPWLVVGVLIAFGEYNSQQQLKRVQLMIEKQEAWAEEVTERLNATAQSDMATIQPPKR